MKAEEVIEALKAAHYAPPAWALLEQVGDSTGYAIRHADAIVMGLYPSRGLELHGIEVKVARNDWVRELKSPDKAEVIASMCDRWFIASPAGLIDPPSMPPAWGLLEILPSGKVKTAKPAEKTEAKPLNRGFLAAILRRASAATPTQEMRITAMIAARAEAAKGVEETVAYKTRQIQLDHQALKDRVEQFERESGVSIGSGARWDGPSGADVGRAVKLLSTGGIPRIRRDLTNLNYSVDRLKEMLAEAIAQLGEDA